MVEQETENKPRVTSIYRSRTAGQMGSFIPLRGLLRRRLIFTAETPLMLSAGGTAGAKILV